jgi:hypothetical protein
LDKLKQPNMCCHAFRRFRITSLRNNPVPENLIPFGLGHAGRTATYRYSKLRDDPEFRKQAAEKVGLGFEPPSEKATIGPNGPKIEVGLVEEVAVDYREYKLPHRMGV